MFSRAFNYLFGLRLQKSVPYFRFVLSFALLFLFPRISFCDSNTGAGQAAADCAAAKMDALNKMAQHGNLKDEAQKRLDQANKTLSNSSSTAADKTAAQTSANRETAEVKTQGDLEKNYAKQAGANSSCVNANNAAEAARKADANNDGQISGQEMDNNPEAHQFDTNSDGKVDAGEFRSATNEAKTSADNAKAWNDWAQQNQGYSNYMQTGDIKVGDPSVGQSTVNVGEGSRAAYATDAADGRLNDTSLVNQMNYSGNDGNTYKAGQVSQINGQNVLNFSVDNSSSENAHSTGGVAYFDSNPLDSTPGDFSKFEIADPNTNIGTQPSTLPSTTQVSSTITPAATPPSGSVSPSATFRATPISFPNGVPQGIFSNANSTSFRIVNFNQ